MGNKKKISTGGVSFLGLFFLVLFVLKVTNVIAWSWWWITAPLWGGTALFLAIVLLIFVFTVLISAIGTYKFRKG